MKRLASLPTAAAYVAAVVLANVLTEHFGLVNIGFGLSATAGTFAAGFVLASRNVTQDFVGRLPVIGLMLLGCVLSWWLASPELAIASAVAFALSETTDMGVYSPLRKHGFTRASLVAASVGAVVDTFAFLWLAGFPVTDQTVTGQLLVKVGVSGLAALAVGAARTRRHAVLRESVH